MPAEQFAVQRLIGFCYGHRLLDYDGKCRWLHGHNAVVEVCVSAPQLDGRGMVIDFTDIKRDLGSWIDAELDHRLLLHRDDPFVELLREQGEPVVVLDDNPTAENIARLIFDQARDRGLPVTQVRVWETPNACAIYGEA